MLDKLDAEFAFGREALDVRATRQALLSANIANADTPGYLARDVDFSASLSGALRRAGATGPAGSAGAAGLSGSANAAGSMGGVSLAGTSNGSGISGGTGMVGMGGSNGVPLAMSQPAGVTSGMTMASTEAGHMAGNAKLTPTGGPTEQYSSPVMYRNPTQPALDGNTVDLDTERVQFADNALHFESGMTVLSQQIKTMLSAITSGSS